jgi:hypothetical protein
MGLRHRGIILIHKNYNKSHIGGERNKQTLTGGIVGDA